MINAETCIHIVQGNARISLLGPELIASPFAEPESASRRTERMKPVQEKPIGQMKKEEGGTRDTHFCPWMRIKTLFSAAALGHKSGSGTPTLAVALSARQNAAPVTVTLTYTQI